jgi:hypothetical protein
LPQSKNSAAASDVTEHCSRATKYRANQTWPANRRNAYSVRYDQVNAMLLNKFFKEHRKVEEQEKRLITKRRN